MNIKEHYVFKNCFEKIYRWCLARLTEECSGLDETTEKKARERFELETDILINKGFFCEFYITALIVNYAKYRKRLAVVQGVSAYSYVAYLLGITEINPITAGYPAEIAFSGKKDRCPFMPVYIPRGFGRDLVDYLKTLFGNGLVRREELCVILGDLIEQDKDYLTHTMRVPFIANQMVSKADAVAASRGSRNDAEIFIKERKAIFQNMDMFVKESLDEKYERFMHVIAAARGEGVWSADKTGQKNEIFYTRDDVYRYGMELFSGRSDLAYELMNMVVKGRSGSKIMQGLLKEYGADEKTIELLKGIGFLVSEGACIPEIQMVEYITDHKFRIINTD